MPNPEKLVLKMPKDLAAEFVETEKPRELWRRGRPLR
jgi:hypothetical protein